MSQNLRERIGHLLLHPEDATPKDVVSICSACRSRDVAVNAWAKAKPGASVVVVMLGEAGNVVLTAPDVPWAEMAAFAGEFTAKVLELNAALVEADR